VVGRADTDQPSSLEGVPWRVEQGIDLPAPLGAYHVELRLSAWVLAGGSFF
jgi:hypothetical protein